MSRRTLQLVLAIGVVSLLGAVGVAVATGGRDVRERLTGYEETRWCFSTPASGEFKARVSRFSEKIEYRLSYRDFPTAVTQAHIHFGAGATRAVASAYGSAATTRRSRTRRPARSRARCARDDQGTIEPDDVVGPVPRASPLASWTSSSTPSAPA